MKNLGKLIAYFCVYFQLNLTEDLFWLDICRTSTIYLTGIQDIQLDFSQCPENIPDLF